MRKRWGLAGFALLAVLAAAGCGAADRTASVSGSDISDITARYSELKGRPYETMKVKRVVDGDTFETEDKRKVRLIGVNTPETVKPGSPVERYGKEASNFTKKQLTGKTVYTFKDTDDKDKYGRLLRYVFVKGDARMYNEVLVAEGYANTMTIPPNVMFQKLFLKLEREARQQKKGLWADEAGGAK